jgi:hypothetical protein
LAVELGIKTADEALAVVAKFYPHNVIEPKTRFGLEEIFSSFGGERPKRAAPPEP